MTGNEIRAKFLEFFAGHDHKIVRSSSLIPGNDPTLLFINAGMNQFKETFLGLEKRDYSRAVSSQRCVRAGGKHNDLENVGYTRRHHTFFEMLGNFSFGDYFKQDAIAFAWELITSSQWFAMPKDRLYVTVFREDDEAEELWQKVTGIPKSRIFRLDEKDNFWQMGETGPCGPCSEVHFDLGVAGAEPGQEQEEFPLDGGGRFVEFWNLVFMQYDRGKDGVLTPLPRPSIDTGMGLERMAAILQGKLSNYDCDLIAPIVEQAASLWHVELGENPKIDSALRINADHARAAEFLIHDGVLPSNEGRGYVLRKIMRRALRNGRLAGATEPYFHQLVGFVGDFMASSYPELDESKARVARIVREEETRYATTFQVAERVFSDEAKSAVGGILPGAAAFKLYDTYGLALDEQQEMAREFGLAIDEESFSVEMDKQRSRARASWRGGDKTQVAEIYKTLPPVEFIGRTQLEEPVEVLALLVDKESAITSSTGNAELVFAKTPFYAESGGQVGDTGVLLHPETRDRVAIVEGAYKATPTVLVQKVQLLRPVGIGDKLIAAVDKPARNAIMRNHTATHLLQAALRQVLGSHVRQAGSVVESSRLRFDFLHYTALTDDELNEVERLVNQQILRNQDVTTDIMNLDQALSTGAMALFGEKYGESVRVVSIPDFSRELCGGTHVARTGEIGLFKIISEGSISQGVRRIEAVTGDGALDRFQESSAQLVRASELLNTSQTGVIESLEKVLEHQKIVERQLSAVKEQLVYSKVAQLTGRELNDVTVVAERMDGLDSKQLRTMADALRNRFRTAVVVVASVNEGRISVICAVSKDLAARVQAGKLVGEIAKAIGGKGGGRPDLAEGAGRDLDALPAALESVYRRVEALL